MSRALSTSSSARRASRSSHPLLQSAQIANPATLSREERVRKGADKLKLRLSAKQQGRLDGFFTVQAPKDDGKKRKVRRIPSLTEQAVQRWQQSLSSCMEMTRPDSSLSLAQADDKEDAKGGKKAKTDSKAKGKKK